MDDDKRKIAVLITNVSEGVYQTMKTLCHPDLPKNKTFDQLVALLSNQHKLRVSGFRRRIQFDNSKQINESIVDWFIEVKNVASLCDFGNKFEDRVKDKFVTGLRAGPIQERLCEKKVTKSFKDLFEIALTNEIILKEMRSEREVKSIQKFSKESSKKQSQKPKKG